MLTTEQLRRLIADHESDRVELTVSTTRTLFGRDPLRRMPGAWIQFVRWAGKTMADDAIRAQDALGRNGNPEADFTFEIETSHVLATIWRRS